MDNTAASHFNEISDKVFEFKRSCISSADLQQIPANLLVLQVDCDTFQCQTDLQTQFRGKNLKITTNEFQIQKPCKFDLSGTQKSSSSTDAGRDILGIGRDGKDGCAGENGGNFLLKCKTVTSQNNAKLTVISNGADGMNGQNGGNGKHGKNGKNATRRSFTIGKCDFKLNSPLCAESQKMYKSFRIDSWNKDTSQSVIRTDDGLTAYIYAQTSQHEDSAFMLVKGSKSQPGKQGGRGGIGGKGGCAGNISIQCNQEDYKNFIKIINNPGKNGTNGIDGSNGVDGQCGRDLWMYDLRSWDEPEIFGEDKPTKFKLVWGSGQYAVCDAIKNDYVHVVEDFGVEEPSATKSRPEYQELLANPNKNENEISKDQEVVLNNGKMALICSFIQSKINLISQILWSCKTFILSFLPSFSNEKDD